MEKTWQNPGFLTKYAFLTKEKWRFGGKSIGA